MGSQRQQQRAREHENRKKEALLPERSKQQTTPEFEGPPLPSKNPSERKNHKAPTTDKAAQEVSNAFLELILSNGFIYGLLLACGSAIWFYVSQTRLAPYLVAGGICFAFVCLFHKHAKSIWVRYIVPLFIAALALAALLIIEKAPKSDAEKKPSLVENAGPKLEFPKFTETFNQVVVEFGSNRGVYRTDLLTGTNKEPLVLGGFASGPPAAHLYARNGRLYVDALLHAPRAPTARMSLQGNNLVNKPPLYDMNSDSAGMEVVDERGVVLFSLDHKTSSHIVVRGCFPTSHDRAVYVTDGASMTVPGNINDIDFEQWSQRMGVKLGPIKPLFKHPATKYPGQRLE